MSAGLAMVNEVQHWIRADGRGFLAEPGDQRVVPIVHCFHNDEPGFLSGRRDVGRFGGVGRERLLAQHVLARRDRLERPRRVQRIGQRVVHRVDLRIGEHLVVGAVRLGDAVLGGVPGRPGQIPRGDAADRRFGDWCGSLDQRGYRDAGGAEDPDPHRHGTRASMISAARSVAAFGSASGAPISGSQFRS
jgi:hypothetical protein